ncbi:baseplate J protein [Mergibacter septicus]|uniref:baseplate J/gp47 family protein n=1 Tax=Mergibacter septicus TaxID=221402 RepID=UPI0011790636|nr:baseplate J/gp47 family protein [Mergibacter septicus]AWX14279.1 baseplate J protein [Mergibacter septicus]
MFLVPTFEQIRERILRDYQSLAPNSDIANDSDNYIRASALAAVAENLYAHQSWTIKQFFPDTADTEFLEKHAALRGIVRRRATYASGFATVKGTIGSVINQGVQIKTENNLFYQTTQTVTLESETTDIPVKALQVGVFSNTEHKNATFMSPPVGIQSELILKNIIGGTDIESDASLLARLLELIRRPPAGGNKYDYKNWALSVDGVTSAYVFPLRRGLGTVDIAITSENELPSDEIVTACQQYIDEVRPVTALESKVVKPDVTKIDFDIKVKLAGINLAEARVKIQKALDEYFQSITPGDTVIISQCEAVVSDLIGIIDRKFISPTENKTSDVVSKIEWLRLGTITVNEM